MYLSTLVSSLTKLLSPPYCVGCQNLLPDYTVLCETCHRTLPKIISFATQVTPAYRMTVHAFSAYEQPCAQLIHAKLSGNSIPIFQLGFLLAEHRERLSLEYDILVPVPLHWQRKMWRGFNQAEILADAVSKKSGKPVVNALVRHKKTAFQSTLSAPERKQNVANIFSHNKNIEHTALKNKRVLLIDDLYTTGATAASAAHQLYKLGAQSVELLVACKVID